MTNTTNNNTSAVKFSAEFVIALYRTFDKVACEKYLLNPATLQEPEVSWVRQEMDLIKEEMELV